MSVSPAIAPGKSKTWNIILWIAQVVLAAMFIMAGLIKLISPISAMTDEWIWPGDIPTWLVRFIGAAEVLGALGLVLPSLLRYKPALTPAAAVGLALIMIFAIVFHTHREELSFISTNIIFAALALFIVWGRAVKVPIQPR